MFRANSASIGFAELSSYAEGSGRDLQHQVLLYSHLPCPFLLPKSHSDFDTRCKCELDVDNGL